MKSNLLKSVTKQIVIAFIVVIPIMFVFAILPALLMNTDTVIGKWIKQNMGMFFTVMTFCMVIFGTIIFYKLEKIFKKSKNK